MSLWDPEAAANAAVYLRLPEKEMLELRNQHFEGSKAIWVPYADTGYCKADLIGDGDKPGTKKVLRHADHKEKDLKEELVSIQIYKPISNLILQDREAESSKVRAARRFGEHDVPIRSFRRLQLGRAIPSLFDLHLLWSVLRYHQPVQVAARL